MRNNVLPSAFERWLAKRATDASVRRQATPLTNPIAATPDELRTGLRVFRNNCAGCHGDGYRPSAWGAEFYPPVPQFGRNPPRRPDWQLFLDRQARRPLHGDGRLGRAAPG
jgi:mono/diheme cytochrome c family protein